MGDVPVRYAGIYMPHLPPAPEFATIFNDIGDLCNENGKFENELEKELQDMMQYQINNNQISPNDLNESEINVDGRIR